MAVCFLYINLCILMWQEVPMNVTMNFTYVSRPHYRCEPWQSPYQSSWTQALSPKKLISSNHQCFPRPIVIPIVIPIVRYSAKSEDWVWHRKGSVIPYKLVIKSMSPLHWALECCMCTCGIVFGIMIPRSFHMYTYRSGCQRLAFMERGRGQQTIVDWILS